MILAKGLHLALEMSLPDFQSSVVNIEARFSHLSALSLIVSFGFEEDSKQMASNQNKRFSLQDKRDQLPLSNFINFYVSL